MKNLVLIISVFVFTNTLFCGSIFSKPLAEKIEINDSDEWVLVKHELGINVYFSAYNEDSKILGLIIKFENTLDNDVKVYWSLRKGDIYYIQNVELLIGSQKINTIGNTTMIAPFDKEDLLKDFIINFNENK